MEYTGETHYFPTEEVSVLEWETDPKTVVNALSTALPEFTKYDPIAKKIPDFFSAIAELKKWATSAVDKSKGKKLEEAQQVLGDFFTDFDQLFQTFIDNSLKKDREMSTTIARAKFNQELIRDLAILTHQGASPRLETAKESAAYFFDVVQLLDKADSRLGRELRTLVNGARAQVALMELLESQDYEVLLPNIKKDNGKEVEEWDVYGDTDFVAVPKDGIGPMLFIDVKGVYIDDKGNIVKLKQKDGTEKPIKLDHNSPYQVEKTQSKSIQHSIRDQVLANLESSNVKINNNMRFETFTVFVPTNPEYLDRFGRKFSQNRIGDGIIADIKKFTGNQYARKMEGYQTKRPAGVGVRS